MRRAGMYVRPQSVVVTDVSIGGTLPPYIATLLAFLFKTDPSVPFRCRLLVINLDDIGFIQYFDVILEQGQFLSVVLC